MSRTLKQSCSLTLVLAALPLLAGDGFPTLKYSGGFDLLRDGPGLEKATHKTFGFGVNVSATMAIPDTDMFGRATLSYNKMPGNQHGTARTDLSNAQLALDALIPITASKKLMGVLGLSGNKYVAKNSGDETFEYRKILYPVPPGSFQNSEWVFTAVDCWEVTGDDTKGLKLGARLGLEYTLNAHISFTALWQLTELCGGVSKSTGGGGGLGRVDPGGPGHSASVLPSGGAGRHESSAPPPPTGYSGPIYQRINAGPVNPNWLTLGVRYTF